jgi:hypothetical protein
MSHPYPPQHPTIAVIPPPAAPPAAQFNVPPQQPTSTHAKQKKRHAKKSLEDSVLVTQMPDEETVSGQVKNREAMQKIRDAWIFKQIRSRQQEFTQYRTVRFYFASQI